MYPAFPRRPAGSPYDLTTYTGRVRHFFDMVDPRNNLITDAELQQYVARRNIMFNDAWLCAQCVR